MSGTQDFNSSAQNFDENQGLSHSAESGIQQNEQNEGGKKLSASEKMDMLLRGNSSEVMKKEIEKLRKESAKYRTSSREVSLQKSQIEEQTAQIQQELEALKATHRSLSIMRKLDKSGCIKSDLVAKDIPADCDDVDAFIESYKTENAFLFKTPKQSFGGTFKPTTAKNLTPSQQMDAYIRAALGR